MNQRDDELRREAAIEDERDRQKTGARIVRAEWQPIETAPEGVEVLLWWPSFNTRPLIGWLKDGRWRSDEVASYHIGPTHWMPFPEPPA